jgi:hypothetical protein
MHTSVFLSRDLIRWGYTDYRDGILHQELADMGTPRRMPPVTKQRPVQLPPQSQTTAAIA